ncbi:MAG: ATP-dependent protease ATPase subunit HslU [Bacillota bacterium]
MEELTPRKIVEELDKYIIGQNEAKKSVAVALRNRYRRRQLASELKEEIMPKNILMIGPTGVGKTEIARRLAKLAEAPFAKVEVTKFTEVGYVGRDVESMIRDLVQTAIRMIKQEKIKEVEDKAKKLAEDRILDKLLPVAKEDQSNNPLNNLFNNFSSDEKVEQKEDQEHVKRLKRRREELREKLRAGELEERVIEIEVEDNNKQMVEVFSGSGTEEMGIDFQDMLGGIFPNQKKERKATIAEAKEILKQQEAQKLIDMDEVSAEAIERVEETGIIFLDELDKVAGNNSSSSGPEVSREGVQRDILPIVEGSTVMTKHGPVKTDHIFFIAAGAFHVSKPTDLIPELQGRFPIRVELSSLTEDNFKSILTEPENALIKQYEALLATEDLEIEFTDQAIEKLASISFQVNEETENIGARRLHTVLEKLLEDISFEAPEVSEDQVKIDVDYVEDKLTDIVQDKDLSRYIL